MPLETSDDSSFEKHIKENQNVIVKYYADWCGSCRLFAPKYKRLSNDERFQEYLFLDVNAETNPEARKLGNVKNLPTFAIFKNGILLDSICTSKEEPVVELLDKLKD